MLLLSLTGVIFGVVFLISGRRKELKEKGVRIFIGFFILMELISTIANLYGRYNFSKSLLTSGIFGLVNGILFFWVIRLINEMLTIAARIYKTPDKKTLYINFERVGKKVPPIFYYLLVIGWFILFGRSFYFFRKLGRAVHRLPCERKNDWRIHFYYPKYFSVFPDPFLVRHDFQHCYIFCFG